MSSAEDGQSGLSHPQGSGLRDPDCVWGSPTLLVSHWWLQVRVLEIRPRQWMLKFKLDGEFRAERGGGMGVGGFRREALRGGEAGEGWKGEGASLAACSLHPPPISAAQVHPTHASGRLGDAEGGEHM